VGIVVSRQQGKSTFSKELAILDNCVEWKPIDKEYSELMHSLGQVLKNKRDAAILVDLEKGQARRLNYAALEGAKNGKIMSHKYESIVEYIDIPHVIVLSNECPMGADYTANRLLIHTIKDGVIVDSRTE